MSDAWLVAVVALLVIAIGLTIWWLLSALFDHGYHQGAADALMLFDEDSRP